MTFPLGVYLSLAMEHVLSKKRGIMSNGSPGIVKRELGAYTHQCSRRPRTTAQEAPVYQKHGVYSPAESVEEEPWTRIYISSTPSSSLLVQ